jgi:hypothetical protein
MMFGIGRLARNVTGRQPAEFSSTRRQGAEYEEGRNNASTTHMQDGIDRNPGSGPR